MMKVVLLLLPSVFVCMGLSRKHYYEEYGNSLYVRLPRKPNSIEFNPKYSSDVTVVWKWGDPVISVDGKRTMTGIYYAMVNLTQRDVGRYVLRDKEQKEESAFIVEVKAKTNAFHRMPREHLRFTSDLQPNSCNIKFFPESGREPRERTINIVRQGRLQEGLDKFACVGFDLIKPCGISNDDLQMSCKGRYEIKDQNGDTALEVSLEMEPKTKIFDRKPGEQLSFTFDLEPSSCNIYFFPEGDSGPGKSIVGQGRLQLHSDEFDCVGFDLIKPCGISNDDLQMSCQGRYQIKDQNGDTAVEMTLEMEPLSYATSPIGISAGVFLSSLFCCCVRRCCRKSASKEDKSESEAPEPDVQYQVYDLEPVRLRPDHLSEPSGTHYPAQPPYTPTDPLIHNHPTVDVPPAYSEVSAPPVPVHSDSEPRYELKGMTFPSAPPLSSESTTCDVYTSAKFNFL